MRDDKKTYLVRLFELNPLEQSAEIIAARNAFLNPPDREPSGVTADLDLTTRRQAAAQCVRELRTEFWDLDEDSLRERLERLDVGKFPQLIVAVNRMKAVAARRRSFDRLRQHRHCFAEFYDALLRIVVAAPRDAAELREQELRTLPARKGYPHYRTLGEYRRLAAVIEQEFPELFALETEWLTAIGRWKPKKPKRLISKDNLDAIHGGMFLVALIATIVLMLLIGEYLP